MGMFDKIKGRLGKKESDSTGPSDESFDLDDDALFGGDSMGGDPVGTDDFGALDSGGDSGGGADAFDSGAGFDSGDDGGFGTFDDEGGDLGAAQTADFDDMGDIGEAPGEFDDDFGDDLDAPEEKGKKGKKKQKSKKAKRGGGGKVLIITAGAAVAGLAIGFGVGIPVGGIVSGNSPKEKALAGKIEEMDQIKAKLRPLKNNMPLDEVEVWREELRVRRGYAQTMTETEALVGDQAEQEHARDEAQAVLLEAQQRLAVRGAELKNIAKQGGQIEARVAYLKDSGDRLKAEAANRDAHVRRVHAGLPESYSNAATAEAARVLNVRNVGSASAQ